MDSADTEWLNFGVALLWLGGAAWFARRNRPDEPAALRRVPLTVLVFVSGLAVTILVLPMVSGDLGEAMPFVVAGALIVGLATFFSALIVDAGAAALGATRTPKWLACGIVMAILVTYCWLSFMLGGLIGGGGGLWLLPSTPVFFTPALLAAAAASVWWSELPRPVGDDAARFD